MRANNMGSVPRVPQVSPRFPLRKTTAGALLAEFAVAAILSSCASPFLERARDPLGWSGGVGLEGTASVVPNQDGMLANSLLTIGPTGYIRYAWANRWSFLVRTGGGLERAYDAGGYGPPSSTTRPFLYLGLAGKYLISQRDAMKLAIGGLGGLYERRVEVTPSLCEVSYLHDFGEQFTGSVRVGFPALIGLSFNLHPDLSSRHRLHIALSTATIAGVGLGAGLEWHEPESPVE